MIDIKWRIRDYYDLVLGMTLDDDHREITDMISDANKSHDYLELIDNIEQNVFGAEFVLACYLSADRIKLQDAIKCVVQSMYDHCPGLKKAIEANGSIDPDYLPT